MDLIAYVKGDITVVTEILSQVAMLTDSDNFLGAVTLAMIAGFAASLLQGLLRGGQFSVMGFFIPAFLYTIAILPRADLVIENDRTGAISRIDSIPVGVAIPISLITLTGHEITEMMETALGLADTRLTTDNSVLFGTRAPLTYQWMLTQPEVIDIENKGVVGPSGLHIYHDARAYVLDCVAPELATGRVSYSQLTSGDIDTAFRINNRARVLTTAGDMACEDAFDDLNSGMGSTAFLDGLEVVLNNYMQRYPGDTEIGPRYRAALQSLVDDEGAFVKSIVWMNALSAGTAMFKGQGGGESSRAALNDALVQRLENNRGAAAILFETMNMVIAFLEAWAYGVMPLMLLVLVFGAIGWPMAAKYFWVLVWIQLWHLTVLIVLDFMDMQARVFPNRDVDSIAHARSFLEHAMRLEDTGYMMLSITTMLSMAMIYGTSAVFGTGLQRAISGADHYNENKVFADTLSRAPTNAMQSSFEHSPSQGWQGVGAASSFGSLYFSLDRSRAHGVSQADLISQNFGKTVAAGRDIRQGDDYTRREGEDQSKVNARGETVQTVAGRSLSGQAGLDNKSAFGEQFTVGDGLRSQTSGTLGADGSLGLGTSGPVKVGGNVSAGIHGIVASDNSRSSDSSITSNSTTGDGFNLANKMDVSHTSSQRNDQSVSRSDQTGVGEAGGITDTASAHATEATQFVDSRSETSTDGTRANVGTGSVNGIAVANNIAKDPELFDKFMRVISEAGVMGEVEHMYTKNYDKLYQSLGDNQDARMAFAGMYVLQGMGGFLGGKTEEQLNALNAIGDDFLEAVTFGSGVDFHSKVDNGELLLLEQNGRPPDERMQELALKVGTNIGAVKDTLANQDNPLGMMDVFRSQVAGMGAASEEVMGNQVHSVFSAGRKNLDERIEALTDSRNWAERMREDGVWKGITDTLGFTDDEKGQQDALAYIYRSDRSNEGVDATFANRMERLDQATHGQGPDDVKEYMALEQLRIGAAGIGLLDDARYFEGRMLEMHARNPALAGEEGETIRELARNALTAKGFSERLQLAEAVLSYGDLKSKTEAQLGMEIADDGSKNGPSITLGGASYSGALSYTEQDIDRGARTLIGEAGNQGVEGQQAVANVLRNRIEDDRWGDSLMTVAIPGQFSALNSPENGGNALAHQTGPGDPRYEQARAIMVAVMDGQAGDITGGATHYYSPEAMDDQLRRGIPNTSWQQWWPVEVAAHGGQPTAIGGHIFAGKKQPNDDSDS